jgi:hypothetical protein
MTFGEKLKGIFKLIFILLLFRSPVADIVDIPNPSASIQAGIDIAFDGDTVLVGAGIYDEQLVISGKTIILASHYILAQDTSFIANTIIDGNNRAFIIRIDSTVGPGTSIIGFTIQNGTDGIYPLARFNLQNNRIIDCSDGIDYETGSGGLCQDNIFENNSDDGIDLDGAVDILIVNNKIINNGDDGIEIRLHEYSGPLLNIAIQNNFISGNEEDGIQLIDYPDISDRIFYINNNLIINNAMAGIGCMSDGNTTEDYEGASIIESIYLFNNTIFGNEYGVTGGDNLTAKNNIIANCNITAMKNVDNNSLISFSNFWNNGLDFDNCNINDSSLEYADPSFVNSTNNDFHLTFLSSCIDKGDTLTVKDPDSTRADTGPFYYHQSLSDFSLIIPSPDTLLKTLTPGFLWQTSRPSGEEPITYDLYYSEDPLIPDSLALIVQDIADSVYTFADTINDFSQFHWKVLAKNPWSLQKWSTESWTFSVNSDSASPVFNSVLPVINFNEDDSIFVMESIWYPFIDDDATDDSLLLYQISQGNRVSVSSQGDTNIFKSELNWFGSDTLQLSVTDLGDSTSSSSFIVLVNPVNDPPKIHNLPDSLSFFADSSSGFNLWDYVTDIESPDSLLSWDFNSLPDSLSIDYQNSTGQLTVSSSGFIGNVELVITVTDDSNAVTSDTLYISSMYRDIIPPLFLEPLPSLNFNEDNSVFVMNSQWYPYIYDEGTADTLLTYSISQGKNVSVVSHADTNLFKAGLNWYGSDTLQLSVTDLEDFTSSSPFVVVVNSVNDPPEIHELPESLYFFADSSTELNLWDYISDIESPDSLLTVTFNSSPESLLINFQNSSGVLSLSSSGFSGTVELAITIADENNSVISDTIQVHSIFRDINPPQFIEPLPVINFDEDDSVFVKNSFWYPYIYDAETADSLLTYTISQGQNISVISMGDTNLFKAGLNWFGSDTLQLSVSEPENLSNSSSFIVSVNPVNDPPIFHDLPDSLSFFADSSIGLNLWDYVTDIESPDSLLSWDFNVVPDSLLIDFQNSTGRISLSTSGFIGKAKLLITAIDDSNATCRDTLEVTSLYRDIKSPQIIEPLPLINFNEDDSIFVKNSFWYPYFFDEGTADSLLTFRIAQGKNISVISLGDTNLFKPVLNWFGSDTLQIFVTDRGNMTSSSSFIISINSVNDPPVFSNLPDSVSIEYQSSYSFNVWDFVDDIETPDSLLIYKFLFSDDSIQINFEDKTGQIELSPIGDIRSTVIYIQVTDDSSASIYDSVVINIQKVTGLDSDPDNLIPDDFVLKQNFPNPFNPVTTITFGLPEASNVRLEIYDILGKKIATIFEGKKPAGYHSFIWNANNFSSGLYIYRFSSQGKRYSELIKKMILLK